MTWSTDYSKIDVANWNRCPKSLLLIIRTLTFITGHVSLDRVICTTTSMFVIQNFGGSRSLLPQKEFATLNTQMHEKHVDQESLLLGASVFGPSYLWREITRRPFFEEQRTSVSGHIGRTGASLDLGATLSLSLSGSSDEHLGHNVLEVLLCNVRSSADRSRS